MKNILIIVALIILASCTTTKYVDRVVEVPVETVKTEYITDVKYDSLYVKDSIFMYIKGDTVFKYKEKQNYKYVYQTDTVVRVDSIPKVITVTKTDVQYINKLTWVQKILMYLGMAFLVLLTGFIIFKFKK